MMKLPSALLFLVALNCAQAQESFPLWPNGAPGALGNSSNDIPTLTAYLRSKFDNESIRVVTRPKKTDSLEVYIGEEFLGVLFLETEKGRRSYIFELPILDVDLVD